METTNTQAVTVWNKDSESQVRQFVSSGASVPKALMKSAPKGFVQGLRATRKAFLMANTAQLLGGFTDKGYQIVSASAIKTLKNGVEQVTLRLATPKPTSNMTMAEFAKSFGTTVEEITATFGK